MSEAREPRTVWGYQGQGTIKEGVGSELHGISEAEEVLQEADEQTRELLGINISDLLKNGSLEELREHQQLVKFIISAASTAVLMRRAKHRPFGVTSHSLGDYAALVTAGVFTLKTGIHLVHERQVAMDQADSDIPGGGGMAGVTGLTGEQLERFAQTLDLDVAAINTETSGTLAGQKGTIDKVPAEVDAIPGVGAKVLDIRGAAHSRFNAVVARRMKPIVEKVEFKKANIPFFSGEGRVITDSDQLRQYLLRMFSNPVMFIDASKEMGKVGVERFIEVAPTRLLGSFIKRTLGRDVEVETLKDYLPFEDPDD